MHITFSIVSLFLSVSILSASPSLAESKGQAVLPITVAANQKIREQRSLMKVALTDLQHQEGEILKLVIGYLNKKKIPYEIVDHGLFKSVLVKPGCKEKLCEISKTLAATKQGMRLSISPILAILLRDSFGAGYFGYNGTVPEFPSQESVNSDLLLVSHAVRIEHSLTINPTFIEVLDLESPIIRHELDHANFENSRRKSGATLSSIRGRYGKGFTGAGNYNGELNVEEVFVQFNDTLHAISKLSDSEQAPQFLTMADIARMNTAEVVQTDAHRWVIIQKRLHDLAQFGKNLFFVGRRLTTIPPENVQYILWNKQVWAHFSVAMPGADFKEYPLQLRVPLVGTTAIQNPENAAILKQMMHELMNLGTSLQELGEFSGLAIESFQNGKRLQLYPKFVKLLKQIKSVDDLKSARGMPLKSQDYIERMKAL